MCTKGDVQICQALAEMNSDWFKNFLRSLPAAECKPCMIVKRLIARGVLTIDTFGGYEHIYIDIDRDTTRPLTILEWFKSFLSSLPAAEYKPCMIDTKGPLKILPYTGHPT